jgi:hypothetical protein
MDDMAFVADMIQNKPVIVPSAEALAIGHNAIQTFTKFRILARRSGWSVKETSYFINICMNWNYYEWLDMMLDVCVFREE